MCGHLRRRIAELNPTAVKDSAAGSLPKLRGNGYESHRVKWGL